MKTVIVTMILLISAFAILTGCSSMTDRGSFEFNTFVMPDGKQVAILNQQNWSLFTPSTEERYHYICPKDKCEFGDWEMIRKPDNRLDQKGSMPSIIEAGIRGVATMGAGALIGNGLSQSGSDINAEAGAAALQEQNLKSSPIFLNRRHKK